jgi:hypothetical protein
VARAYRRLWSGQLDALATTLAGENMDIAHPEPLFDPIHKAYKDRSRPQEEGPGAERPEDDGPEGRG